MACHPGRQHDHDFRGVRVCHARKGPAQESDGTHPSQGFRTPKSRGESCGEDNYRQSGQGAAFHWYDRDMKRDHASFQRRPFLTPIWLTAIAVLLGFSFAVFAAWVWGTAGSTTVIVIRHAEKDLSVSATDPPLTAAGEARAELLAGMFGDGKHLGHLDAIYVSPALRNRLTAAPLAARLGIAAAVVPADDPRGLARRALHEHAGGRVLIIGHSDTVPQIVSALSGNPKIPEIQDQEYGTMYIVTVPRIGRANLLRLNY
jgi:broad specificity phosphatase PhoE